MAEEIEITSKRIGQSLLEEGLLTQEQLEQILSVQPRLNQRLGETAVALGLIGESDLAEFLARYFELPYVDLADAEALDPAVVDLIPESLARRYHMMMIKREGDLLTVAMADPLDVRAVDALRLETGCRIQKMVASRNAIQRAIDRTYHAPSRLAKSMDHLLEDESNGGGAATVHAIDFSDSSEQVEKLKHEASDAPVVQFVNLLLMRAIQERASDIHIEPQEDSVCVRIRVDGQLREVSAPPRRMFRAITTRIKLLGNLDIADRRLPQDGRFNFSVFGKTIDVRLSSLPTVYGEKLVLRLLDRATLILDLTSLGFEPKMLEAFQEALHLPNGLVILTGPTGSGKTTTLYAALNIIKTPTKNIVTIEDPVEYRLSNINQVHTKAGIGLTFAAGLRSVLRQDPDIIMVGEIRDAETAEICIRSAMTGHLVLSTLHTNDSVSAVSRLIDMGIESYLLSASLTLVMAQRLVRRVCQDCAVPYEPPEELHKAYRRLAGKGNGAPFQFYRGKGCTRCGQTGYFGRVAIYEQFVISETIRDLVSERARLTEIRKQAQQEGLQTLLQSSLNKVREGVTTLEEAFSVCVTQREKAREE